jgi:Outer membrane protein beta-barrel domain
MKKALLLAFFALTAFFANAQVTVKPGIRGGVNFSSLTNSDFDTKTDFYVGTFAAVKLTRFYTLQPEITYSRQGAEGKLYYEYYDSNTGNYVYDQRNVDVELQYIALALINKFTLTDSFNIHVGPTFDIIANSPEYVDTDVDVGITAGLGYTLPFGLTIEARVKKGFVDVMNDYDYDYSYDGEYGNMTNLVFSVGLSYSFKVTGSNK